MAFQYLNNIALEEAVTSYLNVLIRQGLKHKKEVVKVQDASGRVTASPVYANICAPHYHACAMDGIALKAELTFGATETTPVFLSEASYIPVDTGDPLPDTCDAVVMIEDVIPAEGGVKLYAAVAPWQNIRQIGEDICAGEMLLTSFSLITPAATGAMLAGGILEVEVVKKPLIGIIPTGDEIVMPVENPGIGDIIEFNSTIFKGMLEEWGARVKIYPIVKDSPDLLKKALGTAITECDAVILNAGSSAGREDYACESIAKAGKVLHHGIAIKPGKPVILGYSGAIPVLGVPGYPVSAILVLDYVLRPVISYLTLREVYQEPQVDATVSRQIVSSLKYTEFIRVRLGKVNHKLVAVPLQRGAGVVSSFVKADGILTIPQNSEGYQAGQCAKVTLLKPLNEINKTLLITGSHDPLIDEIAELMKRDNPQAFVASSHVGSMGGIFAVKRGEAHLGAIHLLDELSGEYNNAYVKKYFSQGQVFLAEGVKRIQGLMVRKNNPKNIKNIGDLAQPGISYVNRQKGSGTRILIDYLCKQNKLEQSLIYGYNREEYTHTSVAALIAANSADVGLGIYSAAKIYDLDFIPICTEEYDFLINSLAFNREQVQHLLEIIASPSFKNRILEMGGYEVYTPGKIKSF